MLRTKTVIIAGAGASQEFGLPLGTKLKETIAQHCNIEFADGFSQSSGDRQLWSQMARHSRENSISDANVMRSAAVRIARTMPLADSIDEFVESEQDANVSLIAKMAIAKSIMQAESRSTLRLKDNVYSTINFQYNSDTWINRLFSMARKGANRNRYQDIFENMSIVTFNYDRCIEHYLFHAVKSFFQAESTECERLISELQIFHPYGTPGAYQNYDNPFIQGSSVQRQIDSVNNDLSKFYAGIRTYSEIDANAERPAWLDPISQAERVIFLGCHFHTQNLALTRPDPNNRIREVFATAMGRSQPDKDVIEEDLKAWSGANSVYLFDGTCVGLMDEFSARLQR